MLRRNCTTTQSGSARVHKMGGSIDIEALQKMAPKLGASSSITLRGVGLNSESAQILGAAIATNNELALLSLGNNGLGDKGVHTIAAGLAAETEGKSLLKTLSLDENSLSDAGIVTIAELLSKLPSLTELHLHNNPFTDKGAAVLFDAIKAHSCLENVIFFGTEVSSELRTEIKDYLKERFKAKQPVAKAPEPSPETIEPQLDSSSITSSDTKAPESELGEVGANKHLITQAEILSPVNRTHPSKGSTGTGIPKQKRGNRRASTFFSSPASQDPTLGSLHAHRSGYPYSFNDVQTILIHIRKADLFKDDDPLINDDASKFANSVSENPSRIFLADPYYCNYFHTSLIDDVKTILGQHDGDQVARNKQQWSELPTCMIIPVQYHEHWHCIRITIDYTNRKASILWDDPMGAVHFKYELKKGLWLSIIAALRMLYSCADNPEEKFYTEELSNNIIQQADGLDNHCGPVILANIADYCRNPDVDNKDFAEPETGKYTIPAVEPIVYFDFLDTDDVVDARKKHRGIIKSIRAQHIEIYKTLTADEGECDEVDQYSDEKVGSSDGEAPSENNLGSNRKRSDSCCIS